MLFLGFLLGSAGVTPVAAQMNRALNRPAAASSVTPCCSPLHAVDGRPDTRWTSHAQDEEWIYMDLGTHYMVDRVVLRWAEGFGRAYTIEVSDLAEYWHPIFTETNGDGGEDDLQGLSGTGRYVRMRGLARGTASGYSLWAFEVYGHQPGAPRASFIAPLGMVYAREPIAFDASATVDAEGDAITHTWDFGDGTTGTGVRVTHTYTAPGTYTVTYTATDATGQADVIQRPIEIHTRTAPNLNDSPPDRP